MDVINSKAAPIGTVLNNYSSNSSKNTSIDSIIQTVKVRTTIKICSAFSYSSNDIKSLTKGVFDYSKSSLLFGINFIHLFFY